MAVKRYYTVNGRIRGEGTTAGGFRAYGTDALGSVTATYTPTGASENAYRYAPYGTVVQTTGAAADPKYLWNGSSGYRNNSRNYAGLYVRARHYDPFTAKWTTIDPFWPREAAYQYARLSPALTSDPTGLYWLQVGMHDVIGSGMHSWVRVIDNVKGSPTFNQSWNFDAGPENFGIWSILAPGVITDYSGPDIPGQLDYPANYHIYNFANLEKNDKPVGPLLNRLRVEEQAMMLRVVPYRLGGPNSNSFAAHLIHKVLGPAMWNKAFNDQYRYQWFPGLWDDPWADPVLPKHKSRCEPQIMPGMPQPGRRNLWN